MRRAEDARYATGLAVVAGFLVLTTPPGVADAAPRPAPSTAVHTIANDICDCAEPPTPATHASRR